MSLFSYAESEPPENNTHPYDLAFIAIGLLGSLNFNWDSGNQHKNYDKHHIAAPEIEAAIRDKYAFVALIPQARIVRQWSDQFFELASERRYLLFSRCCDGKYLQVVFTLRSINNQIYIRPISAHYMKEKDVHRKIAQSRYNDEI